MSETVIIERAHGLVFVWAIVDGTTTMPRRLVWWGEG
jgi:hypothetical protein